MATQTQANSRTAEGRLERVRALFAADKTNLLTVDLTVLVDLITRPDRYKEDDYAQASMARRYGVELRTIIRSLKRLEAFGYIVRVKNPGKPDTIALA